MVQKYNSFANVNYIILSRFIVEFLFVECYSKCDLVDCRVEWCSWWGHGEAILPKVYGCLQSEEHKTPSLWWRIFWHRLPPYVVHGSPGLPAEAAGQAVRAASLWLQDPPTRLWNAGNSGNIQGTRTLHRVQQWQTLINILTENTLHIFNCG